MNKQERSSELLFLLQQARQAAQEESPELRWIEGHLAQLVSQEQSLELLHLVRAKSPTLHDIAVVSELVRMGLLTSTDFAVLLGSLELRKLSFQHTLELVDLLISGQLSEEQFSKFIEHDDSIHEKRKSRQHGYTSGSHIKFNDSSPDLIVDNPLLRYHAK